MVTDVNGFKISLLNDYSRLPMVNITYMYNVVSIKFRYLHMITKVWGPRKRYRKLVNMTPISLYGFMAVLTNQFPCGL